MAIFFLVAACGEKVEVPPAHVGIVLHKAGYEGSFLPPSAFRLDVCVIGPCPQIVLISTQDEFVTEEMDVFLPASDIQIDDIQINMRVSIRNDEQTLRAILDKVSPVTDKNGQKWVHFKQIYRIYAKERIRAIVREAVAEKELEWLLANRGAYGNEVFTRLKKELLAIGAPIAVKQLSFAKLNPPPKMKAAFLKAKEREIAIQQADADKRVAIKIAEADLEVAHKKAAVRLVRAQAFADEAVKMAAAVTPQWLSMRRLEVMEAMAENNSAVFFPVNMSPDTALNLQVIRKLGDLAKPKG